MIFALAFVLLLKTIYARKLMPYLLKDTIFHKELIIFKSNFNITKILVSNSDFEHTPNIFFTISSGHLDGGSSIYVLQGHSPVQVLEGGRDTTSDYVNQAIYFGANDGVYEYNADAMSAFRFSKCIDDIIQIQKATDADVIYYLTDDGRMYKLEMKGNIRREVSEIGCASQFVLDSANNIYYIDCEEAMPSRLDANGNIIDFAMLGTSRNIKLLRPAFAMDRCVPYLADGDLYFLHSNGTVENRDFYTSNNAAYSLDAGLYIAYALNGNIYAFNGVDYYLKSMFGVKAHWPKEVTKLVTLVESMKEGIFKNNRYKWKNRFV